MFCLHHLDESVSIIVFISVSIFLVSMSIKPCAHVSVHVCYILLSCLRSVVFVWQFFCMCMWKCWCVYQICFSTFPRCRALAGPFRFSRPCAACYATRAFWRARTQRRRGRVQLTFFAWSDARGFLAPARDPLFPFVLLRQRNLLVREIQKHFKHICRCQATPISFPPPSYIQKLKGKHWSEARNSHALPARRSCAPSFVHLCNISGRILIFMSWTLVYGRCRCSFRVDVFHPIAFWQSEPGPSGW